MNKHTVITGKIHSLETFGLVDGPGVRCVVFLQGCHMRCRYCHNPETWSMQGGELGTTLTGCPKSNLAWPLTPDVMYWSIRFLHERYHLPLMITENGMAGHDWVALDGKVHDPDRIDYLTRYLRSCKRAVEEGLPLIGYMHWSIMDNFEWARGYDQRFGLIHVDYGTQKRTLKDSAYWYATVIAENGENL